MTVKQIVNQANKATFYTRVAFIVLKAAQNVSSEAPSTANHANRLAYANRIFMGNDKPNLIAMHIAAANGTIAGKLESEAGGDSVTDSEIEFAMGQIWDARANAFAPT